jgi:hypothetical protein
MYQNFSISLSSVKLSECGSKTGIKLMSFCECGKRTMMITSSGLWLKVSGIKATEVNTENGND